MAFHMIYVIGGIVGLILLFYIFMFVTSMIESQRLSGDVELVSEPFRYTPTPYWRATRTEAQRLGLLFEGDFATKKNTSIIKGLQSMWITPDRQVIVAIISGGILKKTILRSRLANGIIIESTDEPSRDDVSQMVRREVLLNAGIEELMNFHRQRILLSGISPSKFHSAAITEYEKVDTDVGARLVEMGMARWVNPQKSAIKLTFHGAMVQMRQGHFKEMGKMNSQLERAKIPRAGS